MERWRLLKTRRRNLLNKLFIYKVCFLTLCVAEKKIFCRKGQKIFFLAKENRPFFAREKFNFMRNKGFFSYAGTFFMNYIAKGSNILL